MSCIRDDNGVARCACCNRSFNPYWDYIDNGEDAEAYTVKLCEPCFEDSIEEFEEKRRERIAIANEY